MIDKKQFYDLFQSLEKELTIEIIEIANTQIPEIIMEMTKNIEDHDFSHLKLNGRKLTNVYCSFFDPVSSALADKIEETAEIKLVEIIRISLREFPDILDKIEPYFSISPHWDVMEAGSLKNYLVSIIGPLSEENAVKLEELKKRTMADGIPQIFSELKIASELLLEELQLMKLELSTG